MSIDATLLGTIVLVLVAIFGLIFIAVLALKSDLPKEAV